MAAAKKKAVKKAVVKTAVKKTAVKKAVVKKSVSKKPANAKKVTKKVTKKSTKKAATNNIKIKVTQKQRHKMICEAAYYISLSKNYKTVNPTDDWLQAEAAINKICSVQ